VEVGGIAPGQSAPEFNTTRDDFRVIYIGWKGSDFLGAEGFKTRRGCGEKGVFLTDDMPLDPFLGGGALGHLGPRYIALDIESQA
jgi:hypothetical protein